MTFKKMLAALSAFAVAAGSSSAAMSAFAENGETDYWESSITTYLYSPDDETSVTCRFYEDMPNVPYISFSDYYKCWTDSDAEIVPGENGTYSVTVPTGAEAVIDTNNDSLSSDSFSAFCAVLSELDGSDDFLALFSIPFDAEMDGEEKPVNLDFSAYDIDLHGDDNDIWFPVTTLCDIFSSDVHSAYYFTNVLFFCNNLSQECNTDSFYSADSVALFLEEAANGRNEDMIKYNYNELCFVIDNYYGFPGRIPLNSVLAEKGLDAMLSETNDDTRLVKEHLLSTDVYEYITGLDELGYYMYDGGHTVFSGYIAQYLDDEISQAIVANEKEYLMYEGASDVIGSYFNQIATVNGIMEARAKELEEVDNFIQFEDACYIEKGDTAMFSFDFFLCDADNWSRFYTENGEMPQDVVSEYCYCLGLANENPDIKNFVIDLGTNVGGLTTIGAYMMSLISDVNYQIFKEVRNDINVINYYVSDKNLDGAFDEIDDEVEFDLNYGVICSNYSFSMGNYFPVSAKDAGILLIGETSGGGSCAVSTFMTPDGVLYSISSTTKLSNLNGDDIDLGAVPHYDIVKINDDGTKDYSDVYNFDNLSKMFAEYYGEDTPAVTTSSTTESTVTTTTTTVADSVESSATTASDSVSTETTETATTSVSSDSTTSETTIVNEETMTTVSTAVNSSSSTTETTTDNGELPETGYSRYYSVIEFIAFLMVASGAGILTVTKKKKEN